MTGLSLQRLTELTAMLLLGAGLGMLLSLLHGPMPYLFGGILGAGSIVALQERRHGVADRRMPQPMRFLFVALAGGMIGASFSPDLGRVLARFWISGLAVFAVLILAHAGSYVIMRRVGGYRPVDALFAAMPGGLVEASILGEQAGADPKPLAIQHFIRVLLVVLIVPLLFLAVTGKTVGSAAGQAFSSAPWGWHDVAWLLILAPFGLLIGARLRFPAGHLMGPMLLSAALHGAGLLDVAVPNWLLNGAQLVIGAALGGQISGLTGAMLTRGLRAGLASVIYMIAVAYGAAWALAGWVPANADVLFLAFAPGGVTEMSLIALSLQVSPVLVAMHHMIRIVATVFITQAAWRWLAPVLRKDDTSKTP